MLKKIKLPLFSAILGELAAAVFLVWFKNVPGVPGLLVWHPDIAMITMVFKVLLCVIPVLLVLALFVINKKNGTQKSFLRGFLTGLNCAVSYISVLGACGLMVYCISSGNRMTKNYTKFENPLFEADLKVLDRIAVSSDPHWNNEKSNASERTKIIETVGSKGFDAFFCLGDISDWGDEKDGYEEPVKQLNAGLKGTPFFGLMGNHDALIAAYNIFNQIFYGKKNAPSYFRMDYGNVHFIVLDLLWGDEEFDEKQKSWLITQLESIPSEEKVIVLSHAFILSSGYVDPDYFKNWYDKPSMIANLCPIFEKYKVDLVISGHNHLMEMLEKDGVHYAVIGAMGGKLDPLEYDSPYSLWCNNSDFGFIDLDLSGEDEIGVVFKKSDGEELWNCSVASN